jgi:hypothetical protein
MEWVDHWISWVNIPVYRSIRRIDVLIAIGGLICTTWYAWTAGLQGAITGTLLYAAIVALAVFVL